jgi:uncharacterized phage protein (TIGR01671 family)
MSREIKFKQYWRNDDTGIISTAIHSLNHLKNGIGGVDRHTLIGEVQYTDLRDKNDVEIYEGDIVRRTWHWKNINLEDAYSDAHVVIEHLTCGIRWLPPNQPEDEGFKPLYRSEEDPENLGEFLWDLTQFEVIGNVYESSELLETAS